MPAEEVVQVNVGPAIYEMNDLFATFLERLELSLSKMTPFEKDTRIAALNAILAESASHGRRKVTELEDDTQRQVLLSIYNTTLDFMVEERKKFDKEEPLL